MLGPTLFDIIMNDIAVEELPPRTRQIEYGDDTIVKGRYGIQRAM